MTKEQNADALNKKTKKLEHLVRNANHESRTTNIPEGRLTPKLPFYRISDLLCEQDKIKDEICKNCYYKTHEYQKPYGEEILCKRYLK